MIEVVLVEERDARRVADLVGVGRQEVLVPAFRGVLIRLLNLFPSGLSAALPVLDRMGRRRRARYLAQLARQHGVVL